MEYLDAMLKYDPLARPTSLECLSSAYFTNLPRPTTNNRLVKVCWPTASKPTKKRKNDSIDDLKDLKPRKLF